VAPPHSLLQHRADHATFLIRQGRLEEAETAALAVLTACATDAAAARSSEIQQLVRELALARAGRGLRDDAAADANGTAIAASGLAAACQLLDTHQALLGAANRLLLVHLALGLRDTALAARHLDIATVQDASSRPAQLLRVRLLLQTGAVAAAEPLAGTLVASQPDDEEAAVLLAESRLQAGRPGDALAALERAALPSHPSQERAILAAVLGFEVHGAAAGLARLGRLPPGDGQQRLLRVFATAWPDSWCPAGQAGAVRASDIGAVPLLPRLVGILAQALAARQRGDLACLLLAAALRHLPADQRLPLCSAAAAIAWRTGQRRSAWAFVGQAGSPLARLRCLIAALGAARRP
jgi:hypothetical protein